MGDLNAKKPVFPTLSRNRILADNAILAALYAALTLILQPFSFGVVQFRVSEVLVLLAFWRPDFILGLTVGCLVANVASFSPWDILFGTLATALAAQLVAHGSPKLWVATLWPILANGVIVGSELYFLGIPEVPLYLSVLYVALGEAGVMALGYILFLSLRKNASFWLAISPRRHADWHW